MAFPSIGSTSNGNTGGNATTFSPAKPSGAGAGDRIIIVLGHDGAAAAASIDGFTSILDAVANTSSNQARLRAFYRDLDGSEGATFAGTMSSTEAVAWGVYRIPAGEFDAAAAPEAQTAEVSSSSANPNPPQLIPSWGADDTLWIACYAQDGNVSNTAYPTDYSLGQLTDRVAASTGVNFAMAARQLNDTNTDPLTFTSSASEQWAAATIAIKPAAAGGGTFALSGSASIAVSASGALGISYPLAGSAAQVAISAGTANLAKGFALSGSAAVAVSAGAAALSHAYALSGAAQIAVSAAGDLDLAYALTGSASIVITASSGDLVVDTPGGTFELSGSAAIEISAASAALGLSYPLSGSGQIQITAASAALSQAIALTASGATISISASSGDLVISVAGSEGDATVVFDGRDVASIQLVVVHAASLVLDKRHEASMTTSAREYDINDSTFPTVTFSIDGTPTDPTIITLTVVKPDGTSTTYNYGEGSLTKVGTGIYRRQVTLDQRGVWGFTFRGTGTVVAAVEDAVTVRG